MTGQSPRWEAAVLRVFPAFRALRVSRAMPAEAHRKPAVCAWTPGRSGLTGEDGEEVADFLAASERIG